MPTFSEEEKSLLKAYKPDAFGLNHYGTSFVAYDGGNPAANQNPSDLQSEELEVSALII